MTAAATDGSAGDRQEPEAVAEEPRGRGLDGPLPEVVRSRVVALAAE